MEGHALTVRAPERAHVRIIARRRHSHRRRGYSSVELVVIIFMGRTKGGHATIGRHDHERLLHVKDHTFALVLRGVRNPRRLLSRKTIRVIRGKSTLCHNCVPKVFSVFFKAKFIEMLKLRRFSCRIVPWNALRTIYDKNRTSLQYLYLGIRNASRPTASMNEIREIKSGSTVSRNPNSASTVKNFSMYWWDPH